MSREITGSGVLFVTSPKVVEALKQTYKLPVPTVLEKLLLFVVFKPRKAGYVQLKKAVRPQGVVSGEL